MNMQTTRIDVIALARSGSYAGVCFFSAAYKLMETSLFLSESLIRAAMPAMLYAKHPFEWVGSCGLCSPPQRCSTSRWPWRCCCVVANFWTCCTDKVMA